MAHRNSPQADALKPGEEAAEFPRRGRGAARGGLAAFGDDGDDLMPALARKIVSRDEDDAALVEVAFAGGGEQAQPGLRASSGTPWAIAPAARRMAASRSCCGKRNQRLPIRTFASIPLRSFHHPANVASPLASALQHPAPVAEDRRKMQVGFRIGARLASKACDEGADRP